MLLNLERKNPFQSGSLVAAPISVSRPQYQALQMLRLYGQLSRTSIAELIGYSPSKITSVVNDLLDAQMLEECGDSAYTGGRRAKDLYFNSDYGYFIAVLISADKLDIAVIGFDERTRIRRMLPIQAEDGPGQILDSMIHFVMERLKQFAIPIEKVYGVGITLSCAVHPETGTPYESAELPGWGGFQMESFVREMFPYAVVVIEHDTNAMAFGELRKGAGKDHNHFIYVNLSHAINVGLIINQQIYRGANGRSGELNLSHQSYGADTGISRITTAALEGDAQAQQVIDQTAREVGQALAGLVNLIDPELILLGGSASVLGHPLLATIRRSILDLSQSLTTQHLQVDLAPLGAEAALMGILAMTAEQVFTTEN